LVFTTNAFCQSIQIESGFIFSHYLDKKGGNYNSLHSEHAFGNGLEIRFSNTTVLSKKYKLKNSFGYIKHFGRLTYNGNRSKLPLLEGKYKKQVVFVSLYPININFCKHFEVNIGASASTTTIADFRGTQLIPGFPDLHIEPYSFPVNFKVENNIFTYGLSCMVSYHKKINKHFLFVASYSYYYGLTKETIDFPFENVSINISSIRNGFSLGLKRNI